MSNGYLRLNFDDTVSVGSDSSSTEAISRKRNLWAHDDSFTIETIITPMMLMALEQELLVDMEF